MNGLKVRMEKIRGDMSVKAFAESLGVTPAYIYALEAGEKTKISKTLAELISTKFNVPKRWLLSGEGPMYYESKEYSRDDRIYIDEGSHLGKLVQQLKRIYNDSDKSKIEALKGMMKHLDIGTRHRVLASRAAEDREGYEPKKK